MPSPPVHDQISNSKARRRNLYSYWSAPNESHRRVFLRIRKGAAEKVGLFSVGKAAKSHDVFSSLKNVASAPGPATSCLRSTSFSSLSTTPNATIARSNLMRIMDGGTSYTILRKCVKPEFVQKARKVLTKMLKERRQSAKEEVVFVNIFEKFEDWPDKCKMLLAEIKVSGSIFMP